MATARGDAVSCLSDEREIDRKGDIRVFVHLARDKDARQWRKALADGSLVGINEETPYGYGRAEHMGCQLTFSRSHGETVMAAALRLTLRAALGFDVLHAWRQREDIARADVVWTHTESQYLAVAAVARALKRRPRLLGQTVWLMDRWPSFTPMRRALFRALVREVDMMTFHSPLNLGRARDAFPTQRLELVPFGIPTERLQAPRRRADAPIRILALGNDRHRDWDCLLAAVAGEEDMRLRILSGSLTARRTRGARNIEIGRAQNQAALVAAFDEATLVCVPLTPNLHASGATVLQEAVLAGVPVIASDAGGLDAYFGRDQICFVPPGDARALREAIRALGGDPEGAQAQARRAQARITSGEIGAEAYIRRHVELSRELLGR